MRYFKIMNVWDCLRGKACKVEYPDGRTIEYLNVWQLVNHLRGKPFMIRPSGPRPDLETLRNQVADNPADAQARISLGACLADTGSLDEGYREYLKAIALLSNAQVANESEDDRRLSQRAFARYMAARVLEQMGHDGEAREQWQGCAEDWQAAIPQKKYLRDNAIYQEALEKLGSSSTG